MNEFIREVWSNFFFNHRMNRQQLSKWYRSFSGNFCNCSQDSSSFPFGFTWWLFWMLRDLYGMFWRRTFCKLNGLTMDDVDFTGICGPDVFDWNLFKKLILVHKAMFDKYNFIPTRNYALVLDSITPGFGALSDLAFDQNRIYKECALHEKKFEEQMKAKYWEILIPTILYSFGLRIIIKSFFISFFKKWISRKKYYYVKLAFLGLDLSAISYIVYACSTAYNEMLVKFESDVQSFFVIN